MGVHQGLVLVAVYAKYHSAERTNAGYLILSDLTPKIKLRYQFYIRFNEYHQPHISEHGYFDSRDGWRPLDEF